MPAELSETAAEEFRAWVLDPARTSEELLPVVHFLYWGRVVWGWKHKNPSKSDYDRRRAEEKHRRLHPAVRPQINQEELEATLEVFPTVTKLETAWGDNDRPVRDLSVLRWLPQLEEVSIRESEVRDLSPL